jgi:hypothetical protein
MIETMRHLSDAAVSAELMGLLRCPVSGSALRLAGERLVAEVGGHSYRLSPEGIPLFADQFLSAEARTQQAHYDRIAAQYVANLGYPHTQEYLAYLDRALLSAIGDRPLGLTGEIYCGAGEIARIAPDRLSGVVGIDVSAAMLAGAGRLCRAASSLPPGRCLPLAAGRPFARQRGDAGRHSSRQ